MRNRFAEVGLSIALFIVGVALWEFAVTYFEVPPYILPRPLAVAQALWTGLVGGILWPHIWATSQAVIVGYFLGCSVAIVAGAILGESRLLERSLTPYIVAFQSMPKVALAPLIIVWFGYGISSKIVMVALICFFPVFINTLVGVQSVNPDLVNLYRAFSASRFSILFNVKLPSAAGAIFAGLQIGVVMALIGAVVGEFIASKAGLGNVIQASSVNLDVASMFASVIVLSAMGVTGNKFLGYLHKKVVFWEGLRARNAEAG
jgi:NitT/TauT family transport system permease protein